MISKTQIAGIIPAAGFSSRFGSFKPALLIDGKPLILRAVETLYNFCSKIVVIGGYNFEEFKSLIPEDEKIEIVFNPIYEAGMFSSIKKGVEISSADFYFLLPGDYGFVKKETCRLMLEALSEKNKVILPSFEGRKGHPVLFDAEISEIIKKSGNNTILRDILNSYNPYIVECGDRGILIDIDTPENIPSGQF